MKLNILSLLFAAAVMAAACTPESNCPTCPDANDGRRVTFTMDVETGDAQTKAAYDTQEDNEKAVNSVQVFVFDQNGLLNAYHKGSSTSNIAITTTYGTKTVWAVINARDLSAIRTLNELTSSVISLGENSVITSEGFVMTGSKSITLQSAAPSKETISVARLVSRISVCNITNALPVAYKNMTVDYILISNVVGEQNIAGSLGIDSETVWYNKMGRHDGSGVTSTQIIDGVNYLASCPTLTFVKPASEDATLANGRSSTTKYRFYAYPNSSTNEGKGWVSPFAACKTKLIVAATIEGVRYYYPVVIDKVDRNCAYTINLTVTALGSTDPDKKVDKGTITSDISVTTWTAVTEQNVTI